VGDDGGLEIKVPGAVQHVAYLRGGGVPEEYRLQIQGSLYVTGRKWWDTVSYNPAMPSALVRVERDEECIAAIAKALDVFCGELARGQAELLALGCVPAKRKGGA
jgi:hypothetical protein